MPIENYAYNIYIYIFIPENAFDNVVCKITSILFILPQFIKGKINNGLSILYIYSGRWCFEVANGNFVQKIQWKNKACFCIKTGETCIP